LNRSSYNSWY